MAYFFSAHPPEFFAILHDYNNKTLQLIMHNTVNYPSNVISEWITLLLRITNAINALENKTILTAPSFPS